MGARLPALQAAYYEVMGDGSDLAGERPSGALTGVRRNYLHNFTMQCRAAAAEILAATTTA